MTEKETREHRYPERHPKNDGRRHPHKCLLSPLHYRKKEYGGKNRRPAQKGTGRRFGALRGNLITASGRHISEGKKKSFAGKGKIRKGGSDFRNGKNVENCFAKKPRRGGPEKANCAPQLQKKG